MFEGVQIISSPNLKSIHRDQHVCRNYIYEDAFDKLSPDNEANLRLKMRVQLVNAAGVNLVSFTKPTYYWQCQWISSSHLII